MADKQTILASTRKGLFTISPGGSGWDKPKVAGFLGDRVVLTLVDPRDGAWYAALDLGHFGAKLHRSEDRGKTWTEIGVPAYPEGATVKAGDGKSTQPAKLELMWSMAAGGPDQPGRLWMGTIPGGLFVSDDRGASWSLVEALWNEPSRPNWFGGGYDAPGIHSISVDPRDADRVIVAASCGGVWETTDGGESWAVRCSGMSADYMPPERRDDPTIQDAHQLVRCPADPDVLWVQHHNGIYHSTDCGQSWRELKVEPSSFGFAVAVHPADGRKAWFVPAIKDEKRIPVDGALCVTHTADGGATFTAQRKGLPQDGCYDLIYRHGLAIDRSGDGLAFGSTTGNLWATDDGGASWQCVSHTLPPIYAVTFA